MEARRGETRPAGARHGPPWLDAQRDSPARRGRPRPTPLATACQAAINKIRFCWTLR